MSLRLTPDKKWELLAALQRATDIIKALPEDRSCHECLSFEAGNCLRWRAQVPAEAQATGCEQWEPDIPF